MSGRAAGGAAGCAARRPCSWCRPPVVAPADQLINTLIKAPINAPIMMGA